jgi:hypothetical protein
MRLEARQLGIGLGMMAIGFGGWWYNWHLAQTAGYFYIKLCLLAPLAVFGGLIMMIRPEWAGPWRSDSSKGHKAALIGVIAAMAIFSGIDFYRLKNASPAKRYAAAPRVPQRFTPPVTVARAASVRPAAPSISFLSQTYRLGSFNQRQHPMWEFVTTNESVNNWTTMVTLVERADARTREDLDRLAEGLMSNYKAHRGRILLAKTMQDDSGAPYNYMVVGFEQPEQSRYELNFVKIALGEKAAVVAIYGVRVTDAKAKEFLNRESSEIGRALNVFQAPEMNRLPRNTF